VRLKARRSQRRKTKVEAFGNLEFFQVQEESAKAQEEQHRPLDQPIDSGLLKISCPGESRRSTQKRRSWVIGSHSDTRQSLDQVKMRGV
jgi:hypothetical protein